MTQARRPDQKPRQKTQGIGAELYRRPKGTSKGKELLNLKAEIFEIIQ